MNYLIVDDQEDLIDVVELTIYEFLTVKSILKAKNSEEAIALLKTNQIDICICDHNMPGGNGNLVLDYLIKSNSDVKFVLCSTVTPNDMPDFYKNDRMFFNIEKPEIMNGIEQLSIKLNLKPNNDLFIPVSLKCLLLIEQTPADIYLKINDGKFIKCFNKNSLFLNEDFEKYSTKEINKLYIKSHELNLSKNGDFSKSITKLFQAANTSLSEKISTAHDSITNLIKITQLNSLHEDIIIQASSETVSILKKSNVLEKYLLKMTLLGEYPSQLFTLHSILAYSIAKKCDWVTIQTQTKLNLACFLQSINHSSINIISLLNNNDFIKNKDKLTKDEISSFLNSPMKTFKILEQFPNVPQDVSKILFEQYEMPDGEGFPKGLSNQSINTISTIFILSGLFARYLLNNKNNYKFNEFIIELENQGYNKGNFKEPFKHLKEIISIHN